MSKLTELALANAITEILEKKPLDKITVRDITDRCGLTRNTFYYHFQDVYDLVRWIFESKTDDIIGQCEPSGDWEAGFVAGLEYLYEHRHMIYHIYRSISREILENYIKEIVHRHAVNFVKVATQGMEPSEGAVQITADFYKNAVMGATLQWLDMDMNIPPRSLAVLYNHMFVGTLEDSITSAELALKDPEFSLPDSIAGA